MKNRMKKDKCNDEGWSVGSNPSNLASQSITVGGEGKVKLKQDPTIKYLGIDRIANKKFEEDIKEGLNKTMRETIIAQHSECSIPLENAMEEITRNILEAHNASLERIREKMKEWVAPGAYGVDSIDWDKVGEIIDAEIEGGNKEDHDKTN